MARNCARIGLVFGYGLDYYRDILRGIKSFAESRPHWILTPIPPEPRAVAAARPLRHHGMIAHIFNSDLANALIEIRKPVVNVSGVLPELPLPRVGVDHVAVGRLAAAHLLDRGFRHFGFVGYQEHAFSVGREAGFRMGVETAGCALHSYYQSDAEHHDPTGLWIWDEAVVRWLSVLPKPVGILASHDPQGVMLSEACRQARFRVPEDVALVGVDNDDLLCELARPALSSVALPGERIGFEAAKLLDRLLTRPRARPAGPSAWLAPVRVVTRRSSDTLAIDDALVAAALRYIGEHAHAPIQVSDVLRHVPVSRRTLERRVRAVLGRSIAGEIRRTHIERTKFLLADTDMPMADLAMHAGFSDQRQLSVVFRQELGVTPTEYRRKFRARS